MRNIYLILISFIFIGCNNQFNISSYLPKQINNNIQKKQTIATPKK